MNDTKSKFKKLNNGHIVQKDYFAVSIFSRFANVRLRPNSMKISGPSPIKGKSTKELEQLKHLSLEIQATSKKCCEH